MKMKDSTAEAIEKVLFESLKELPEGESLLLSDLIGELKRKTGKTLTGNEKFFQDTINKLIKDRLIEEKYLVFHDFKIKAFSKGDRFNYWEGELSSEQPQPLKVLLSIAGFDPTCAAGVVKDIQIFKKFDFYGCGIITALTAQNTKGVKSVQFQKSSLLIEQLEMLVEEFEIYGVKIGLPHKSHRLNLKLAEILSSLKVPVVFDPVLKPTRGATFIESLQPITPLIEISDVITPNTEEYEIIKEAISNFRGYIVIKGIPDGNLVVDVLKRHGRTIADVKHERDSRSVRGTGCAFSSVLMCKLAEGMPIEKAFAEASEFTESYRKIAFKSEEMAQYISLI